MFWPENNKCVDCDKVVSPTKDRQEIAWDKNGKCRRRCGVCIERRAQESA